MHAEGLLNLSFTFKAFAIILSVCFYNYNVVRKGLETTN